jgi:hypothetical protein
MAWSKNLEEHTLGMNKIPARLPSSPIPILTVNKRSKG